MTCWICLSLSHLLVWCTRRDWFLGKHIPKGVWPHFLNQHAMWSICTHTLGIPDFEGSQRGFLGGTGFRFCTPWTNFPDLSPLFQAEVKQLPFFSIWKTIPFKPCRTIVKSLTRWTTCTLSYCVSHDWKNHSYTWGTANGKKRLSKI